MPTNALIITFSRLISKVFNEKHCFKPKLTLNFAILKHISDFYKTGYHVRVMNH